MTNYILLYRGPATSTEDLTAEQREQGNQAWLGWASKVGPALVEFGTPFGARAGVQGDGSTTNASDLNGYSIVEAADLDGAKALCDGHPFLRDGTGKFAVEVYELTPM
ncbi:YciI family protein [Pengzhenrongella sp.]|jgi:hypothetical protein|uniref:YciI family protein n=1 Tax=Pengzhenrongella sp. TaxID=2888820 RepID=UPI002F93E553